MKYLLNVALLCSFMQVAEPLPRGAPNCPAGNNTVGKPHQKENADVFNTGGLRRGNIEFRINDVLLEPRTPFSLPVDTVHTWSLSMNKTAPIAIKKGGFKGFLVRLAGKEIDLSDAFFPDLDKPISFKAAPGCKGLVGGVTHVNPNVKQRVSGEFTVDAAIGKNITADVTVVVFNGENAAGKWRSNYYFSRFIMVTVAPEEGEDATVMPTENATFAVTAGATM